MFLPSTDKNFWRAVFGFFFYVVVPDYWLSIYLEDLLYVLYAQSMLFDLWLFYSYYFHWVVISLWALF